MEAAFPQFSKFPKELQLLIWETAFNQPTTPKRRVIEGQVAISKQEVQPINLHPWCYRVPRNRYLVFPGAQQEATPPAMLSVCHTSRQVALQHPEFTSLLLDPDNEALSPVWFDFEYDIVILSGVKANPYGIHDKWDRIENKHDLQRIRRVAIPWSAFHPGQQRFVTGRETIWRWRLLMMNLRGLFPHLTDIYLYIPVVRQTVLCESSLDRHPHEPAKCVESLRPVLRKIKDPWDLKLPDCDCIDAPSTLDDALDQLWYAMEIHLEENQVQWEQDVRIHTRWLVREGLDMESLRGVPGIEIDSAYCKEYSGRD